MDVFDQLERVVGLQFQGVFDVRTVRGDSVGLEPCAHSVELQAPYTYRFELPGTPYSLVAPGATCGFVTEEEALAAAVAQASSLLGSRVYLISQRATPEDGAAAPVGVANSLRDAVDYVMEQPGYFGQGAQAFSEQYGVNVFGGLYRISGFINFKITQLPILPVSASM